MDGGRGGCAVVYLHYLQNGAMYLWTCMSLARGTCGMSEHVNMSDFAWATKLAVRISYNNLQCGSLRPAALIWENLSSGTVCLIALMGASVGCAKVGPLDPTRACYQPRALWHSDCMAAA